jgi:hypothetical protein
VPYSEIKGRVAATLLALAVATKIDPIARSWRHRDSDALPGVQAASICTSGARWMIAVLNFIWPEMPDAAAG